MTNTLTYQNSLVVLTCGVCHCEHAIPNSLYRRAREGSSWFCPMGHSLAFTVSEVDRLKRALEREQNTALRKSRELEHERRRSAAARGQTTKLKNRISKGVCPCCNRSFVALASHMARQHPDYVQSDVS